MCVCVYRKTALNSHVVSLAINDVKDELLNPPISIILQHNNPVRLAIMIMIIIIVKRKEVRKKGSKDTAITDERLVIPVCDWCLTGDFDATRYANNLHALKYCSRTGQK